MIRAISLLAFLAGCGTPPTFQNITGVTIQRVSTSGLKRTTLEQTGLKQAQDCLYSTVSVDANASASRVLLETTYLVQVKDSYGDRSFELYTDRHMKGNKGNYYENRCIHALIEQYAPKK